MVRVKTPCFWDISKRAPDLSSVLPLYQVTLVGLCAVSHRRVMVPSSSAAQSFRALVNVWTGSVKRMEQIFYICIYIYIYLIKAQLCVNPTKHSHHFVLLSMCLQEYTGNLVGLNCVCRLNVCSTLVELPLISSRAFVVAPPTTSQLYSPESCAVTPWMVILLIFSSWRSSYFWLFRMPLPSLAQLTTALTCVTSQTNTASSPALTLTFWSSLDKDWALPEIHHNNIFKAGSKLMMLCL